MKRFSLFFAAVAIGVVLAEQVAGRQVGKPWYYASLAAIFGLGWWVYARKER